MHSFIDALPNSLDLATARQVRNTQLIDQSVLTLPAAIDLYRSDYDCFVRQFVNMCDGHATCREVMCRSKASLRFPVRSPARTTHLRLHIKEP